MNKFFASLLISVLLVSQAWAQEIKNVEPDPNSFPVLQKLKGEDGKLSYDYLGKSMGIDAWLLSGPDVMQVIYITPSSKGAMVGGALVDAEGKEISSGLTRKFMEQYPERAQEILVTVRKITPGDKDANKADQKETADPASRSEKFWQQLNQGGKIRFGAEKDAPVLFALLDPAQKQSKYFWQKISPVLKSKKITLYILPIGLTSADSILEIANILGSANPQEGWLKAMKGQSTVTQTTPESNGVLGMKANVEIAQSIHLRQVPLLVYRGKQDKIRLVSGQPKNWQDFLDELLDQ